MDERVKFIAAYLREELSITRLSSTFGVSRKTAYKWIARYAAGGVAELLNRSRRPQSNPNAMSREVASLVVTMRKQHPFWGPKKLLAMLGPAYPGLKLPATSTVGHLLARHGLARPRRSIRRSTPYGQPFLGYDKPNAVWCADFKGHFRMGDRSRVHPLTISDGYSRFLLRCEGLRKAKHDPTQAVFEQAFREYGLPDAMRTDNGPPFSTLAIGGLSRLSVWWIKLGIRPERILPGHPEQNGRHERMHRTLKAETAKPPKQDLFEQQAAFDAWRKEYNEVRPHEALGQKTPASHYSPSTRRFPLALRDPEYPPTFETKRINHAGGLKWERHKWYLSWCLAQELVGLEELDDGKWLLHFGPYPLAVLDGVAKKLRPLATALTMAKPEQTEGSKRKESQHDAK
jgi:transposase InsO family protein